MDMADTAIESKEMRSAGWKAAVFAIIDAAFFSAGIYLAVRASLLRMENIISSQDLLAPIAIFTIYLFVSRGLFSQIDRAPVFSGLIVELALFFAAVVGVSLAATRLQAFGLSSLPLRWAEGPSVLSELLRVSPLIGICLAVLCAALVCLVAFGKKVVPSISAVSFFAAAAAICRFSLGEFSGPAILSAALIVVVPLAGAIWTKPRLFARSILICAVAFFAMLHLLGVQPSPPGFEKSAAGISRIYPAKSGASIPLFFLKSVRVAKDGNIIVSGGGTGKLSILDEKTGEKISSFSAPGADYSDAIEIDGAVLALDSAKEKIYSFKGGIREKPVVTDVSYERKCSPQKLTLAGASLYATCASEPGIIEFNASSLEQTGRIRFRESGATPFRDGAWDIEKQDGGAIYAMAGAAADASKSMLAVIDPLRFRMVNAAALEGAPKHFAIDARGSRIFAAGLKRISEITLPDMTPARTLGSPIRAGAIAFDASRNLIYAGGEEDGVFAVIDVSSGKTLRRARVCAGAKEIELSRDAAQVFLLCRNGIYRIDMAAYLRGRSGS